MIERYLHHLIPVVLLCYLTSAVSISVPLYVVNRYYGLPTPRDKILTWIGWGAVATMDAALAIRLIDIF